jgi:SOS response regulatory protein OraA/RecX
VPDPRQRHPSALISWAHVDPGWSHNQIGARRDAVFELATELRRNGVDVDVDLYHLSASVDWTRWGPLRIAECDFVLVVVSASWRRAWEGRGDPSKGAGAAAEADSLRSIYAVNRNAFRDKVRLVLLPGSDSRDIPSGLHGVARFEVGTIDHAGLSDLLRNLTEQPEFIKGELGALPKLPPHSSASAAARSATATAGPAVTVGTGAAPGPEVSPGKRNALAKAREYLRYTAFSMTGLANQLVSEGFSVDDSEFAVANVGAAWGGQATKKANDYLSHMTFSRRGLVNQLVSEGFSQDESELAVANVSADWGEQAAKKASEYLSHTSFSQSGLVRQLAFDGFTQSEAEAAAAKAYR